MTTTTNTSNTSNASKTSNRFPIGPSILALVAVLALFAGGRVMQDASATVAMVLALLLSTVAAVWRWRSARSVVVDAGSTGRQSLLSRAVAAHIAVAVGAAALLASAVLKLSGDADNVATTIGLLLAVGARRSCGPSSC